MEFIKAPFFLVYGSQDLEIYFVKAKLTSFHYLLNSEHAQDRHHTLLISEHLHPFVHQTFIQHYGLSNKGTVVKGPPSPTRSSQVEGEECPGKLGFHATGSEMEAGQGAVGGGRGAGGGGAWQRDNDWHRVNSK